MSTSSRRSGSQPSTPRSRALSVKHLKDSVKFNKEHAKDHIKAMKEDAKDLKKAAKALKKKGY